MSTASFPALGPAFVISMGYVDLGKWLATVDGGVRFGNDLMLFVLFFNFIAILCQYLATCVGIVTEKNLAEICRDEYSGTTCMILGVQAELSLIISDLTMILGVAHGFNLLLGVDLFACAWSAAAGSIILPLLTHLLNDRKAVFMCEIISGMALVFYVLGVLISQPEIPLAKNIMFPKLSGESAYSLMSLLGANIMVHNFYVHSSVVQQQQKRFLNVPVGALLHEHFFAIMFIFTGISLVNYVLMNSAASVFGSTDIDLNFHDVSLLMDQIFRIPIAPIAVLLLLFSSQIGALAWNTDGPQILHYSFGANVSVWIHLLLVKTSSVIPALFCAKIGGAEGIYKFLIFCQVIQAMLLPSSAIPLFRVASSRSIMGEYKMAWYLDIMSLLAFLLMLASNIFFINEMLFGNSSWINNLKENTRFGGTITYAIILAACALILFTLYLAATPLKSASDFPEIGTSVMLKDELPDETEDDIRDKTISIKDEIKATENQLSLEPVVENTVQYTNRSISESILEQSDAAMDSDNDRCQIIDRTAASDTTFDSDHDCHQHILVSGSSNTFITPIFQPEVSKSIDVVDLESVNGTSANILLDTDIKEKHEFKTEKEDLALEEAVVTVMDKDKTLDAKDSVGELLVPASEVLPPLQSEDSECCNTVTVKISDGSIGSVNLSKLSGLGRATRRQLAAILDEFWGQLFDFHGKPAPEAVGQKYDSLLGLNSKGVSSAKGDIATESSINFHKDVDRITIFPHNPMEYNSHKMKNLTSGDLCYGSQMGSSTWSPNLQAKKHFLSSAGNLPESNERRYSSSYLPQYSDNHDYQPATIHGYQLASYLKEIGASRNLYSSNVAPESPRVTKTSLKVPPGFGDSVPYSDRQNGLNSLATSSLQSPTAARVSRMQVEGNYFNPSLVEPIGNAAYEKKYHSSPDISALIAASRNYYLNESKVGGPIGSRPSVGRMMASQQHQFLNPISRTAVSSPFNELYSPNLQRDALPQSNLSSDSKSLWSMQPHEQFFGMPTREYNIGGRTVPDKPGRPTQEVFPNAEVERRLLQSLRSCILKLLKLENSDWLFRPNDGYDEELIYQVATTEKNMCKVVEMNHLDSSELRHLSPERMLNSVQRNEEADIPCTLSLPNCGDDCIWRTSLVVSFGVWCIHRILDLSLVESRPELWGKYTYVLNRLQGILDLAFSKPRATLNACSCLDVPREVTEPSDSLMLSKMISGSFTTAAMILDIIKEVEISVSGRKGRTGTAAGDVAFPKGKENLASVLKRYKRRLSNKSAGAQEVSLSRKIQTTPVL